MVTKDIIITIFANSSQAPCAQWAKEYFTNEPIVLTVPGAGGTDFRNKMIAWAKTGDAFAAALKSLRPDLKDVEIGRRGLVTFSVGWAGADELFKFPAEREKLDAYLLLDGCHNNVLDHWVAYATRAANMDAFMAMSHSSIKPPFVSSTITNSLIFRLATHANDALTDKPQVETAIPEYVLNVKIDEPIKISLGASPGLPAISKTWTADALIAHENRGNLTRLGYSGSDRCDHVYIAWYVAKRLWQWLGEEWSAVQEETREVPES